MCSFVLAEFPMKTFFYYYFVVESNVVGCTKYEIAWTTRVRAQFHRNEENKKCAFFVGMCTVLSFLSLSVCVYLYSGGHKEDVFNVHAM